ncbi:MAG: recombinase family protein [Clostridiales bacterium]|nr:recombinase family protein [Clostridiales bacterium]
MATIRKIERKIPTIQKKKRVAAYARVSLASEQLMHSLSAQVSYYSSLIQKNPEWEYAGVYSDEGITGTSTAGRKGFNDLVKDCEDGKIDIVLVKSISRFARNTVDLLETVRHLKDIDVEVRFEREHISSFSGDGELMLTILASFAQEESRSMSENIKWAVQKGYQKGEPHSPARTYGYEWNGEEYVVVPEEAEVVRFVFEAYESGTSLLQIPKILASKGIKGLTGVPFSRATLKGMISNEIYIGNLVFQKTYSESVRKRKRNYGEVPQYRVEEAHEPIISKELFYRVQEEKKQRGEAASNKNAVLTCFSGKIKCGKCGYSCSRRSIPHSKTTEREYNKRWVCNLSETKQKCDLRPLSEDELRCASSEMLGCDPFDENEFLRKVEKVAVFDDHLDFFLKDGKKKSWQRKYSRKDSARTCFSKKMECGICGSPLIRESALKRFKCKNKRKSMALCASRPIKEDELQRASLTILGANYEMGFCCEVSKAVVYDERVDFLLKDGSVKVWERE